MMMVRSKACSKALIPPAACFAAPGFEYFCEFEGEGACAVTGLGLKRNAGVVVRFVLAVLTGAFLAGSVGADTWIKHPFGEERRYLKDWLAVCDNDGAGPCRVVQIPPADEDLRNDQRLALNAIGGGWEVSVFDRDMPEDRLHSLVFTVDDLFGVQLYPRAWRQGEGDVSNISDTVTVEPGSVTLALIASLRAGDRVVVTYGPKGFGDGIATFSLRGLTAAMLAVDEKLGRLPSN